MNKFFKLSNYIAVFLILITFGIILLYHDAAPDNSSAQETTIAIENLEAAKNDRREVANSGLTPFFFIITAAPVTLAIISLLFVNEKLFRPFNEKVFNMEDTEILLKAIATIIIGLFTVSLIINGNEYLELERLGVENSSATTQVSQNIITDNIWDSEQNYRTQNIFEINLIIGSVLMALYGLIVIFLTRYNGLKWIRRNKHNKKIARIVLLSSFGVTILSTSLAILIF